MGDHYTAKDKFLDCIRLCKELNKGKDQDNVKAEEIEKIEKTAIEHVRTIWDHSIKPIWWRWWLEHPVELRNKQIFIILVSLLFILLFFHPIYPVLFRQLSGFVQNEKFFSIDWLFYILLTTLLIFILLSPCLNKIKIKDVEIEISSPPPFKFEYSPVSYYARMVDLLSTRTNKN